MGCLVLAGGCAYVSECVGFYAFCSSTNSVLYSVKVNEDGGRGRSEDGGRKSSKKRKKKKVLKEEQEGVLFF